MFDIGAKAEIYRIIDELATRGIAIIVISSEMAEIIGTCDRVLVMREGKIEARSAARPVARFTRKHHVIRGGCRGLRDLNMSDTGSQTAGQRPSGGAGLSTKQAKLRGFIQTIGMLPVLIALCFGFHW